MTDEQYRMQLIAGLGNPLTQEVLAHAPLPQEVKETIQSSPADPTYKRRVPRSVVAPIVEMVAVCRTAGGGWTRGAIGSWRVPSL